MPDTAPLDLAQLDPPVWRVLAGHDVYGPYTLGQMQAFRDDGRILPGTQVTRGAGQPFRPAVEFTAIFAAGAAGVEPLAETHNFLLVVDAPASDELACRLGELCACLNAAPGVFILRSRLRLPELRAALAPLAGQTMLLVDASSNRLAWSGLDPQTDRALRQLWAAGEGGTEG